MSITVNRVITKVIECLEQNIQKQIDCKRPSSLIQINRVDYKIFVLNTQIEI